MKIRPLISSDIENIKFITPEGWADITPYFLFYISNPNSYTFVAEENGKLIGSGNYTIQNGTAWLSHIIVLPEYRGRGIGKKITEYLILKIKKSDCKSILLIATEMGQPVYQKLGFATVSKYLFFKGGNYSYPAIKGLRSLRKEDVQEVLRLDRKISGEDRSHLILASTEGWVVKSGSSLRGFYLPQVWEGPVLAGDLEAGFALLSVRMKKKEFLVIPEKNAETIHFLKNAEFGEFHVPGIRMVLGEDVRWQPQMIYGRISGAFG